MKSFTLFFLSILIINCAVGQNIINDYSYTFDDDALDNWQSQTILNGGDWTWKQNGKADNGTYWNGRDSIHSSSLGGAVVYDADKISGPNNPGGTNSGALESPGLDFTGELTVFLKFHQYYRNFESSTRIEYTLDGLDWIPINTSINQTVSKNVETGAEDYQIIDISSEVGDQPMVRIRFVFEGDYYFWILDDIQFFDAYPYPQTFPEYVGDSLVNFAYPFETEGSDWPYAIDEVVVQFKLGTPEPVKQALRDSFAAVLADSCTCGRLELWRMGDNLIVDGDTLSNSGGTIGIQERIKGAQAASSIDGIDYNKFNYNQMKDTMIQENLPFLFKPQWIPEMSDTALRIAILDTGIDLDHELLFNNIFRNEAEEPEADEVDNDGNCLVDDWVGWNYVNDNNNPDDDHSHGTHVAGIIKQNMDLYDPNCDYRLIPYKTHDFHGLATLFDVACATYQAQEDNASVINDSWGFYGSESIILRNAIDTAKINNVLIVSAAGNDTTDLSTLPQYPACYTNSNIITVGAYGANSVGDIAVADFSNFDPVCVDILAPGVDIMSTVLDGLSAEKSGTSMAAPAVTAAVAMVYCFGPKNYLEIKNNILDCADKYPALSSKAKDGNVLKYDFACITPVEEIEKGQEVEFLVYPNPSSESLFIDNLQNLEEVEINVFNLAGNLIFQKSISQWNVYGKEQIDIATIPAGIYLLKIQHSQYIWTYKFIKI
jgi:subtilisin family serine protease